MKYRTKLYIALISISFASAILALIILSAESEKMLFERLRSQIESIVTSTSPFIDPTLTETLKNPSMQDSAAYHQMRDMLLKVLVANRRVDVYVTEIYLIYPDPKNNQNILYILGTAHDPPPIGSSIGSGDVRTILSNLKNSVVDPILSSDQWGVWLSAYAPILDANNNYIATLGVDLSASLVHQKMEKLILFGLWALAASTVLALLIAYFLSTKVTENLNALCSSVIEIGHGHLDVKTELDTDDEFGQLADAINDMAKGLQERERLKASFARYVSQHILEKILKSDTPLKLEGERRKVTVLFSDIRQFTHLAENLPPEEVVKLLNEYFERMIEVIFTHSGTLDKFIGDGLMAEFGAPLEDIDQEKHAIEAAIEMQRQLDILCQKWEKEKRPIIQMGIGIHTGEAVVGNIGSEKRTEYTAIGDTVNVAARLEQATKLLHVPILISETTFQNAKDHFNYKDLGSVALPGRKEPIRVYTIYPKEEPK